MTDSENDRTPPPGHDDATAQFDAASTDPAPRAWSQAGPSGTAQFGATPDTTQFDDFQPIPGAAPPPVVATSPAKRNTGKIIAGVSLAVILLVVIAGVGTELYVRNKTKDCLQQAFTQLTGTETSVSLSSKPVLLQRISGEVPFVQVDTADKADAIGLHARADGITGLDGTPTARSISGTGSAPFERVITMSKEASAASTDGSGTNPGGTNPDSDSPLSGLVQGATIQSITGNPADGTIKVESTVQVAILPIPVTTTIKPVVNDGHIHIEVVDAQAFIFGVPKDYAQGIVDSVSKSMFGSLADELTVTNLKVTDSGVDFAFDGTDVTLGNNAQMTGNSTTCS
ncbi:LmeA family phospholipid-binding protein [Gordonia sp. CPCC 205515]|uniref:LmeA family phospholipid-binding protein n=1 Tax=Gordonia sp. CPCC 205515 TaxID=3140791 RepID=UPI003AF3765C